MESRHTSPEAQQFKSKPETAYAALEQKREAAILASFTPEEQNTIRERQQFLSALAYFIGKDFRIPVELNEPGAGWHWDFKENKIRIDPKDLLEKDEDYLRFVICHEGGHRRISRTDFIPLEQWREPGFSFMMNAIEDPRDNNFVAESYPRFREQMSLAYREDLDFEQKAKAKAAQKLGRQPRFMQAGFEYIKQWFRETQGLEPEITQALPPEVKAAVASTLGSARDSWRTFPTRDMADGRQSDEKGSTGEASITQHAQLSYEINRDEIWPEFQKLVELDMKDQQMQEFMKELEQEKQTGGQGLPQELKDKLTPEEQKELEEAIDQAIEEAKKKLEGGKPEEEGEGAGQPEPAESAPPKPVDLASLPEDLKQKIKDFIDSLPEDKKKELAAQAKQAIGEFSEDIADDLEGKLVENPEDAAEPDVEAEPSKLAPEIEVESKPEEKISPAGFEELKKFRERLAKELKSDANAYERERREVLPLIDRLETQLREIFVARRAQNWQSGFRAGKRIDLNKRIQEKAKAVSAVESRAWQKRELPEEKDYSISLLVDLSGSMEGDKIEETFKAVIVLAEVLNRLSIKLEILGFNDRLYEYQKFGQAIDKTVRENMGGMLEEVSDRSDTGKANYNDDGWALEQAAARLRSQTASQKLLFVLSDGTPEESPMHPRSQYELGQVVSRILKEGEVSLVGLGIGPGTGHVQQYYPRHLADVPVAEMAARLSGLIKDVIAHPEKI